MFDAADEPSPASRNDRVDGFARAYEEHWERLVRLCRLRLRGDPEEAEAVAQEALTRAWASFDRFSADRPFWPWLSTIARRACVDYERQQGRDVRLALRAHVAPLAFAGPEDLVVLAEEQATAVSALRSLRVRDRRLMELRHLHGWSYEDIARFEGVSLSAVRSALKRASDSFRDSYRRLAGGAAAAFPLFRSRLRRAASLLDGALRAVVRLPASHLPSMLPEATAAVIVLGLLGGSAYPAPPSPLASSGPAPAFGRTTSPPPPMQPSVAAGARTIEVANEEPVEPRRAGADDVPVIGGLLEGDDGAQPDDGVYERVYAAPDGSAFAVGQYSQTCPMLSSCRLVFRSVDGGRTWSQLPAVGYLGGELLFPPSYPTDKRIFSIGHALQMSPDGGRTFVTVAPLRGPGAMSPAFSAGDERIIVGSAPGWVYDASTGAVTPAGLAPLLANPMGAHIGFSPAHAVDRTVFIGGSGPVELNGDVVKRFATLHRCRDRVCHEVFRGAEGLMQFPLKVRFSPNHRHDGVVWAWNESGLLRSSDHGASFTAVPAPGPLLINELVVTEAGAYVALGPTSSLAGGLFRLAAGAERWERVGAGTPLAEGVSSLADLGGGRLVAAAHMAYHGRGRLLWSDDHGATWHAGR